VVWRQNESGTAKSEEIRAMNFRQLNWKYRALYLLLVAVIIAAIVIAPTLVAFFAR
jgi:hypothetical protein